MIRCLTIALCLIVATARADQKPLTAMQREELPSPAPPGAVGAALAAAPDGTVWLSWVEAGESGVNVLRFSTFDAAAKKWRAPRTIARASGVTTNPMDFPQLAVAANHAVAIWTDGHGGAQLSESHDQGATWSEPAPFSRESDDMEKFSLAALADGRVLVAWLDGRAKRSGGKMEQLYARILDAPGRPAEASAKPGPDVLVDPSVCDCCQTTLAPFLDGGALLAYRARTDEEVRDIRTARFRGNTWDEPRPLNHDDWRINACPVNGPRLASDGGRIAAAWFTAADNEPRVLASFSPDAGARFLMPLRVDRGHPTGHVDTLILHDGALLVTWLENDGSLWLRRVSPDFTADEPFALAPAGEVSAKNFPRLALVRDYAGGKTAAQFVTAFAAEGNAAALRTLVVSVPEGEMVDAEKDCDCSPTAEQLQGFPLRGTIASLAKGRGALRVEHGEVPGVLAAGTHEFRTIPNVLAVVTPGRKFLGRIERRQGEWWLFDVRLIIAPP